MPKPSPAAAEDDKKRRGLSGWRAALFGGAALVAGGAAGEAQAADTAAGLELNKPTEYTLNKPAPASELRTPSGEVIHLRVPEEVRPAELQPTPEVTLAVPEEIHQRTLEPAPEIKLREPEQVLPRPLNDSTL